MGYWAGADHPDHLTSVSSDIARADAITIVVREYSPKGAARSTEELRSAELPRPWVPRPANR